MTVHGVDVASYQPEAFATGGLDFVFVKATEGTGYVNPRQAGQVARGRGAGLLVGLYHFLHPGNIPAQARYFVEKCASAEGDILACDWESSSAGAPSCAEKDAFMREVKRLRPSHRVVLYCNTDFWLHRDSSSYCGDGLWIADPNHPAGQPGVQADWLFHQYSISGGMDRNIGNFRDRAALCAWAAGNTEEDPMAGMSKADICAAVWETDGVVGVPAEWTSKGNPQWKPASLLVDLGTRVRSLDAKLTAQSAAVKALADALAARDAAVDPDALVARIESAIERVTVHLDVPDTTA